MEMPSLPDDVSAYKRSRRFTASDVPQALLQRHNTKAGTWGLIHCEKGSLLYSILGGSGGKFLLCGGGSPGVIEPQVLIPGQFFHVPTPGGVLLHAPYASWLPDDTPPPCCAC